jgi:hypothetical protein
VVSAAQRSGLWVSVVALWVSVVALWVLVAVRHQFSACWEASANSIYGVAEQAISKLRQ